jgi:hypothetical protein
LKERALIIVTMFFKRNNKLHKYQILTFEGTIHILDPSFVLKYQSESVLISWCKKSQIKIAVILELLTENP